MTLANLIDSAVLCHHRCRELRDLLGFSWKQLSSFGTGGAQPTNVPAIARVITSTMKHLSRSSNWIKGARLVIAAVAAGWVMGALPGGSATTIAQIDSADERCTALLKSENDDLAVPHTVISVDTDCNPTPDLTVPVWRDAKAAKVITAQRDRELLAPQIACWVHDGTPIVVVHHSDYLYGFVMADEINVIGGPNKGCTGNMVPVYIK